jgi:hypothetical protein
VTSELTTQQLDEIETRAASLHEYATLADEPLQADADQLTGEDVPALIAEVRRLTERLANYGTPVLGGAPLPPPDSGYEQMELARAELNKGFTSHEWAVGRIVCPEGFSCTSHPLTCFKPLKDGRLPVHRHERYGRVCPGSRKKPTTPPLQLRPAVSSVV